MGNNIKPNRGSMLPGQHFELPQSTTKANAPSVYLASAGDYAGNIEWVITVDPDVLPTALQQSDTPRIPLPEAAQIWGVYATIWEGYDGITIQMFTEANPAIAQGPGVNGMIARSFPVPIVGKAVQARGDSIKVALYRAANAADPAVGVAVSIRPGRLQSYVVTAMRSSGDPQPVPRRAVAWRALPDLGVLAADVATEQSAFGNVQLTIPAPSWYNWMPLHPSTSHVKYVSAQAVENNPVLFEFKVTT